MSIRDPDYFDRYFEFGIPAEDLADTQLRQALRDLAENPDSESCARLRTLLINDAARAERKIRAIRKSGDQLHERELLHLYISIAPTVIP